MAAAVVARNGTAIVPDPRKNRKEGCMSFLKYVRGDLDSAVS